MSNWLTFLLPGIFSFASQVDRYIKSNSSVNVLKAKHIDAKAIGKNIAYIFY